MEIVENWSRIVGTVQEWHPAEPGRPAMVALRIEAVAKVVRGGEAYPNLLAGSRGAVVHVQVPTADARTLELVQGARIECEARRGRTATTLFARPGTIIVMRSSS